MLEPDLTANGVHQVVDPRLAFMVGAGQPCEPQHCPLDGHGRVRLGDPDHWCPGLAGQGTSLPDDDRVQLKLGLARADACHCTHDRAPSRSKTVRPRMTVRRFVGRAAPGDSAGKPSR